MAETKTCSICGVRKSFARFHLSGRVRKTDGVMPFRAACILCERAKARKRQDRIRENLAIRKCPVCDNAMAAHGCGSRVGLRENRARLHSGELFRLAVDLFRAEKLWPKQLALENPLLFGIIKRAECVLNKVMGRRWAENQKKEGEKTL